MKPSERRALEAEKRAREAAEWREKELEKEAKKAAKKAGVAYQPPKQPTDTERMNTDAEYTKLPKGEIEVKGDGYHRESFWSNHVRLIAFIVTTVVVLFVVGPLGYDIYLNVRDWNENGAAVEGIVMDEEALLALAEKGKNLSWEDLEAFEHKSLNGGKAMEIDLAGTNLILRADRNKDGVYPYSVSLISYANGTRVEDIRTAGTSKIESFISSPMSGVLSGEDGDFGGKTLTVKDLLELTGKGASLIWSDLEVYERTVSNGCTVMEIKVGSDSGYTLKMSRDKDNPSKITCILVHDKCGEFVDDFQFSTQEAVSEFIASHSAE